MKSCRKICKEACWFQQYLRFLFKMIKMDLNKFIWGARQEVKTFGSGGKMSNRSSLDQKNSFARIAKRLKSFDSREKGFQLLFVKPNEFT